MKNGQTHSTDKEILACSQSAI